MPFQKRRNAGKLLFGNGREPWRIQLAVFLGCRDFLSAKSVMSSLLLQFFARPCSFPATCSAVCAWKSIAGMSCHLCSASAHQSRQSKAPLPESLVAFQVLGLPDAPALDWQCAESYARNSSRFANSKISLLMPLPLRRSSARHPRVQKGRTRLACRKAGRCGPGLPFGREST